MVLHVMYCRGYALSRFSYNMYAFTARHFTWYMYSTATYEYFFCESDPTDFNPFRFNVT